MLSIGSKAPNFHGNDQNGNPVSLSTLLAGKNLILYFYPRDFTRVCTTQACIFRDAAEELTKLNAHVVGVSTDSSDSHHGFAREHRLNFPLVADPDRQIARAYEADRWLLGLAKRITYVITPDRTIVGAFQHELSAQKHLDDVRRLLALNPASAQTR